MIINKYIYKTAGQEYLVAIVIQKYASNRTLALELVCLDPEFRGETFTYLTVNLNRSEEIPDSMKDRVAFVDTNNNREAEQFIKENKLGKYLNVYGESGFCSYPLYEFNIAKFNTKDEIEKYLRKKPFTFF